MFRRFSMGLLIWALSVTASGPNPALARVDYDGWHAAGAPSRIHFKVSRDTVVELAGLSSSCGISQLGPMGTVSGTVVKTSFADDAIAIVGFVLQENTGVRRYFNLDSDALTYLGNADSGWVMQGLHMFLRTGSRVAMTYQMFGASGRVQMVDGVRPLQSR
jgi:hypothetical protein